MGVVFEKNVGSGMTKALLRCLERNVTFDHQRRPSVAEQSPGNVRQA
jgi:hypothetical protein